MLRKRSQQFENDIQEGFAAVRELTGAWLHWVNPPVTPIGLRGKMPIFAMTGTALYDLAGWTHQDFAEPRSIGVELKQSRAFKPSLPIIGPNRKGSGLQYHQLEALAAMHREGHIAGLLWSNGGAIGVAKGDVLAAAFYDYEVSRIAEDAGQRPTKGAKSIRWDKFCMVIGEEPEAWYLECFHKPRSKPQ